MIAYHCFSAYLSLMQALIFYYNAISQDPTDCSLLPQRVSLLHKAVLYHHYLRIECIFHANMIFHSFYLPIHPDFHCL